MHCKLSSIKNILLVQSNEEPQIQFRSKRVKGRQKI